MTYSPIRGWSGEGDIEPVRVMGSTVFLGVSAGRWASQSKTPALGKNRGDRAEDVGFEPTRGVSPARVPGV